MFTPHKSDTGAVPPWEYLGAAAGEYKAGQLLQLSGGKLAAITAACKTTPPYLCMADMTAENEELVPVIRVSDDMIYETQLSAAAASAAVGTKLEVSAGGLLADAAAEGTFEITYLEDTAAESTVYGRFI